MKTKNADIDIILYVIKKARRPGVKVTMIRWTDESGLDLHFEYDGMIRRYSASDIRTTQEAESLVLKFMLDENLLKESAPMPTPAVKLTHVKPAFYAIMYEQLKNIAKDHGYNLLLHGSLARDFDLVAVPWNQVISDPTDLVKALCEAVGGKILPQYDEYTKTHKDYTPTYHGRNHYVIDISRLGPKTPGEEALEDKQYYMDISVFFGYEGNTIA
jgi:hypothetical protein